MPEPASLHFLLRIFLGGSIFSHPRDTYYLGVGCFDLAEEHIFDLPIRKVGYKDHGAAKERISQLAEPLIAAVIMTNLQMGRHNREV